MNIQKRVPVDVVSARLLEGKFVLFTFSDGVEIPINLARYMRGPIFDDVVESGTFKDFVVDADSGTIVWPNGADLDPEVLRYSSDDVEVDDDFAAKARQIFVKCGDLEVIHGLTVVPSWLTTSAIRIISEHPVVHLWDAHSSPAATSTPHVAIRVAPFAVEASSSTGRLHRVLV